MVLFSDVQRSFLNSIRGSQQKVTLHPRDTWQCLQETVFIFTTRQEAVLLSPSGVRPVIGRTSYKARDSPAPPPPQRILQSKMQAVPQMRNPDLTRFTAGVQWFGTGAKETRRRILTKPSPAPGRGMHPGGEEHSQSRTTSQN